jgi:hypothetical protein
MDSLASLTQADRREVLVKRADDEIANAREQITKADEQIARVHEELSKLESVALRHAAAAAAGPTATAPPRAAPDHPPSRSKPMMRGLVSLLLAAFIIVAAIAWRSPYGDTARSMLRQSAPQLAQASLPSQKDPALSAQPAASVFQTAAGDQSSQQQPVAQSDQPAQPNGATSAGVSPELAETLQALTRGLANLTQAVEQLRSSQDRMAGDSARALELLKDNQEQMTRLLARLPEPSPQVRAQAAAPRTTTATRMPAPTQPTPAQSRANNAATSSTARAPLQLR